MKINELQLCRKWKTIPNCLNRYGLYIFAFTIPISFIPAQLGVALAFLGWVLEGVINRRWQIYKSNVFIPIALYLTWKLITASLSINPMHSVWCVVDNEWQMLLMLMMLFSITELKTLKRILHLWLITSAIDAIYAIWQTFSGYQLHRADLLTPMGDYFRAVGFYGFYLTFAGFVMTVFIISLCLSVQNHTKYRWLYIITGILSFLAILGTFARSIWLSIIVAIPIFGFMKGKKVGSIIAALLIIVILSSLIFIPTIRERAFSIISLEENQTRLNLWRTSINIVKDFPIIGVGEDNFTTYFDKYKVEGFYDTSVHPHNDYLNILVSAGIPGFIFFLAIWFVILKNGFIVYRKSKNHFLRELSLGSALAIIAFMVGSIFQNYYGTYANCWGWWFIAGLLMSSFRLHRETNYNNL